MKPTGKIGLYDSGLGRLNILRHIADRLPQFSYIYLGDTAHKSSMPKEPADVRSNTQQAVSYLFDQGCELVVIASNVSSSLALRFIQQHFLPKFTTERKVLGVIVPAVEAAVAATKSNRIGVIGAQSTVESGAFALEIQKLRPEVTVYQQAAPELVPMIESGIHNTPEAHVVLRHYLAQLVAANVDTLVLGCTQYALIYDQVVEVMGPAVAVVQEGPVVAESLQAYLSRHSDLMQRLRQGERERRIIFTANADVFAGLAQQFYGSVLQAEQVELQ